MDTAAVAGNTLVQFVNLRFTIFIGPITVSTSCSNLGGCTILNISQILFVNSTNMCVNYIQLFYQSNQFHLQCLEIIMTPAFAICCALSRVSETERQRWREAGKNKHAGREIDSFKCACFKSSHGPLSYLSQPFISNL